MTGNKQVLLDPQTVLDGILNLDISECDVTVCLASLTGEGEGPDCERLQLSDELTDDFRVVVKDVINKQKKKAEEGDLTIRPYDPGSKPDPHEIEYLDLSAHDSIKDQIASLSPLTDLAIFAASESFVSALRFYVIIVQPKKGDPVFFFRSYSKKKELHRSPLFAALFTQGHFDRVRQPMFLFDHYIDCMCRGNHMFILGKDKFQKIFRFFEMVLKTAKRTLSIIKGRVPIANFDEFAKACEGHLQMLAKLKNVAAKPYLKSITMADVKRVMREFPQLKIQTTKKDGKEMLLFDPSNKWELLRLLDDDYLKSLMTGQNYEVTGKRIYG